MASGEHSRSAKLAQVFDDEDFVDGSGVGIKECFNKMEKLLISEMKTWWDHNSLKKYVDKPMIPRGLRLKKTPTTMYTESFDTDWQIALSTCSITLMKLIISQEETKLQTLEGEINNTRLELDKYKDAEGFNMLNEKMTKNVDKLEQSIMQTKISKFKRDVEDYTNNQVYTWSYERNKTPKSILKRKKYQRSNSYGDRSVHFPASDADNSDLDQSIRSVPHVNKPMTRSTNRSENTDTEGDFLGNRLQQGKDTGARPKTTRGKGKHT